VLRCRTCGAEWADSQDADEAGMVTACTCPPGVDDVVIVP
jgi:hypothetical protein